MNERKRDPLFGTSPDLKEVVELSLDRIRPDPNQPRKQFNEEKLWELARTIEQVGLLQPITVRKDPEGDGYIIVTGERRFRAHQLLGRPTIEAIIRRNSEGNAHEIVALIENLQREDLTPFEEAEGYQRLMEEFGYTQEEVAEKVGKAQNTVSATLSLNALPRKIREEYPTSDRVSKSVLIEIAGVRNAKEQLRLWKEAQAGRIRTVKAARQAKTGTRRTHIELREDVGRTLSLGKTLANKLDRIPDEYLSQNQGDYAALLELVQRMAARLDAARQAIGEPAEPPRDVAPSAGEEAHA